MADELTRSTELIEQLLGDPELRQSFRSDPAAVLRERGLGRLARGLPPGERAMLTLELRESRSSLAGVIVAAAAEGVDFTHVAEHAAPRLGRDAGRAISHLVKRLSSHHAKTRAVPHETDRLPRPRIPQLARARVVQMAKPLERVIEQPAASPAPSEPVTAASAPVSAGPVEHHAHHAVELAAAGLSVHDPYAYPGNGATAQQIAAWMGACARRVGLPPELPVMASLTESGLRNLDYGDRDSVGFFQMRTSIWDEGPYAGYPANPQKQIEWFISEALAVKRSDPSLAADPSRWGEWVADVERPAAEYRYRYQLQFSEAEQLLRGAGSLAGSGSAVTGAIGAATASGAVHHVDLGVAVKHSAMSHHARHHGGHAAGVLSSGLSNGGLSSGAGAELVRSSYAEHGVQLPVTAAQQFEVGATVPRADLAPGDAVFFGTSHDSIEGVGVYVGDGHVAVGGGREVSLGTPGLHYLGARRFSDRLLTGRDSYARTLPTIKKQHHHRDR